MEYGRDIAAQYRAYRPPLHSIILSELFDDKQRFNRALDIGCGVGHSALALLPYSEIVTAIDPSQAMIDLAISNKNISYHCSTIQDCEFDSESFDLISLAGSLNYCHSEKFINELARLIRPRGTIIIYDFDVMLDKIYTYLEIVQEANSYDHQLRLGIQKQHQYSLKQSISKELHIEISIENLVHLLLADPHLYSEYSTEENIYQHVYDQLKGLDSSLLLEIPTDIFAFKYS